MTEYHNWRTQENPGPMEDGIYCHRCWRRYGDCVCDDEELSYEDPIENEDTVS